MSGVKPSRVQSGKRRRTRPRYQHGNSPLSRRTSSPFAPAYYPPPLPLTNTGSSINEAYYGTFPPRGPPLPHGPPVPRGMTRGFPPDPMLHVPEFSRGFRSFAHYYPPVPRPEYYRSQYASTTAAAPGAFRHGYAGYHAAVYGRGSEEAWEDGEGPGLAREVKEEGKDVGLKRSMTAGGDGAGAGASSPKHKLKKKRRTCDFKDCTKFAQGNTKRCVKHGGGNRCQHKDCTKSAAGTTRFCISHGGGKRCSKENCPKSAIPPDNFCFAHGGGKRCAVQGCQKGARGVTKYCIAHGGGRRCQMFQCRKSDQGGGYCIAHGGGKKSATSQSSKRKRKAATSISPLQESY